jgi:hypothetical protein
LRTGSRLMSWPSLGRGGSKGVRDSTLSLHITSSASGRTIHRTFSRRAVTFLVAAGAVVVLMVVVGFAGLLGWAGSTVRMHRLQGENDSLRVQFRRLGELENNLARMSELNEKMQKMLGVDQPGVKSGADLPDGIGEVPGGEGGAGTGNGSRVVGGSEAPPSGPAGQGPPRRGTKTD